MNTNKVPLAERDAKAVWHPFTPYLSPTPIAISYAKGNYLYTTDGRKILDAISSWWVNLHGHCHPHIIEAVSKQLETIHQIIFAYFTHEPAVTLSERLLSHLPNNQSKIFFSDNGSTAVEVALKMCVQYWFNQGKKRTTIIALENAYHGDTFGAMAVGERDVFVKPFDSMLFDVKRAPFPGGEGLETLDFITQELKSGSIAAFICEPLVQGAGGMLMYSPKVLSRIFELCAEHGVPTIADEVMTGFGRTGTFFACDKLSTPPDILCLSKGLTGGTIPMGITSCSEKIFEAYKSSDKQHTFLHGHSFTGNALSCAAALASLDLLEEPHCQKRIAEISDKHSGFVERLKTHPLVHNARSCGTIVACDVMSESTSYNDPIRDIIEERALANGVLLRPLGNILYAIPPYSVTNDELAFLYDTIIQILDSLPER